MSVINTIRKKISQLFRLDYRSQRLFYWNGLTLVTIISFLVGLWGYYVYDTSHGIEVVWATNFKDALGLLRGSINDKHIAMALAAGPELILPWQLKISSTILPIFSLSFVVLVFVSLIGATFRQYLVRFKRGHVIVVGESDEALAMMDNLVINGYQVVAIWDKKSVEYGGDPDLAEQGVIFIGGRPTTEHTQLRAGIRSAQAIITIEKSSSYNLESIILAHSISAKYRPKHLPPLQGISQISDFAFHQQFATMGLPSLHSSTFNHRVFSQPSIIAQQAWRDNSWYVQYLLDDSSCFHAVIFGFGSVGQDLTMRIARQCYLVGISARRITVIDAKARELGEKFFSRVPWISQCCDLHFVDFDAKGLTPGFLKEIFHQHLTPPAHNYYVCFDQDDLSLQCFQSLLQSMRNTEYAAASLYIRLSGRKKLATLFESFEYKSWYDPYIHIFGEVSALYGLDYLILGTQDRLARQVHEFYTKTYGTTLGAWETLSEVFKESNRQQADHMRQKLISVGCTFEQSNSAHGFRFSAQETTALAELEHQRWLAERLSTGWKYAERRNDDLLLHPSMVPFDQLSEEEKAKDANAVTVMPDILGETNFSIYRQRRIAVLPRQQFNAAAVKKMVLECVGAGEKLALFTSLTTGAEIDLACLLLAETDYDLYVTLPYIAHRDRSFRCEPKEDVRLKELFTYAQRVLKVAISGQNMAEKSTAAALSGSICSEMEGRLSDKLGCSSIWDRLG